MQGGVENSEDDPVRLHGVKRRSVLFDLPYWQVRILSEICCALIIIPKSICRATVMKYL